MKIYLAPMAALHIVLLAGCVYIPAPTEAFKRMMDNHVGKRLNEYTQVYTSAVIEKIDEVQPGVREFFFVWEESIHWPGKECRFVFTVETDTVRIISWRYNGNPDNCRIASK